MKENGKTIYLDNVKVFLTALVILHHAAITYGGSGGWFYQEVKHTVLPDSVILTMFVATNQSFFMGLFFFISGCFVATSLARKSAQQFFMDKLIRLGTPVALFIFLIYPLTIWVGYYPWTFASFTAAMPHLLVDVSLSHTGPAWFVLVLLIFNMVAVLLRRNLIKLAQSDYKVSSLLCVKVALAIGAISFLTRLIFPEGFSVFNIQLCYLPQYIFYFFAGVALSSRGIHQLATTQKISPWLIPAVVLAAVLGAAIAVLLDTAPFLGGTNFWSIFYSFSQGFQSVAFSIVFLVLFYRVANQKEWLKAYASRAAYGAFFIHALVLVAIAIALKSVVLMPMLKFLLLGIFGVPVSFVCGYWLTKLPFLRRVF